MKITFSEKAWEQGLFWQQTDKQILKKIHSLIKEITRTPFEGTGKPEALKDNLQGFWSRRINGEHRIVYRHVNDESIEVASCRFHYGQ